MSLTGKFVYIYIYIYIYVCVCVYKTTKPYQNSMCQTKMKKTKNTFFKKIAIFRYIK